MVLLSLTVLVLGSGDAPVLGTVRAGMMRVLGPVGNGFRFITTPARNAWGGVTDYGTLKDENIKLRKQLDELRTQQVVNADAAANVEKLKTQLNIPIAPAIPKEVAQVTSGNFSSFDDDTAQIDKGSDHGLQVGNPVITEGGLVGLLTQVYANRSVVRLITDPDMRVGVRLKSNDLGSGRGRGFGADWLVDQSIGLSDEVAVNDPVMTSGVDRAKFPPEIPIGSVTSVTKDVGDQRQILGVKLAADLSRLDYVQVLKWTPQP